MCESTALERYLESKLKMVRRDFCITPTAQDVERLKKLQSEYAIDRAVTKLIKDRL